MACKRTQPVHRPCVSSEMKMPGQVEVAEGEKEILQQEAETAVGKLRSEREAMSQQQKRLAQMQHLPPHMQELQQQVKLCTMRFCGTSTCASSVLW